MYSENRRRVQDILELVRPRVVGQGTRDFVATDVDPGDDAYPGHEMDWASWSVHTRGTETDSTHLILGLSYFIAMEELNRIFESHFGAQEAVWARRRSDPRYRLEVVGVERALAQLPMAVAIQDRREFTRFLIEWGANQKEAQEFKQLYEELHLAKIGGGNQNHRNVISRLQTLQPLVYARGPEPVLPFESNWLINYPDALQKLTHPVYTSISLSPGVQVSRSGAGNFITSSQITAWKRTKEVPNEMV